MPKSLSEQISALQRAIAAQEALRPAIGEEVVDAALAVLRQKLFELERRCAEEKNREQRKMVTVMYADISGFTPLTATLAQDSTSPRPASTTLPGHLYPQIDAQLRATFRISAPGAQRVLLDLSGRQEMTRDDNGAWTITRPLTPGFHYYSFIVDGVALADPASESYFGMGRMVSGIEVPSQGEDFYEAKNVPHGEVRIRSWLTRSTREPTGTLAPASGSCVRTIPARPFSRL